MIACNPGDIVLVRFPFTDLTSTKRRPAVVLNDANCPRTYGDFVLIPLTSQPQSDQSLALHGWGKAGLPKPTWAKPVIGTMSEVWCSG